MSWGLQFVLSLIGQNISLFESPEATFLSGLELTPAGEFDYIVRAAIENVGHVFGSKQMIRFSFHGCSDLQHGG